MSNEITLPKILDIPEKLLPMVEQFDKYRYFLLVGGRGGGKSQSIVRFVTYLADKYRLRVVCAREQQVNLTESVYSIFTDLIAKYQLTFDVQATKITSRNTESTINFRGLNEKGRFNIQGLENVSVLFCDEAQALTQRTLDVLIPTIRRDDAKIFFSMNRYLHNDPVYSTFVNRSDCLTIHINFNENEFCTQALKHEAAECLKISENDFNHIWLGQPMDQSEDALFTLSELNGAKDNKYLLKDGYGMRIAGFDVARFGSDKNAAVVIQQMGALHWEVVFVDEWEKKDTVYTTGRILQTSAEQRADMSIVDCDGLGVGPSDTFRFGHKRDDFHEFHNTVLGYQADKSYGNKRTMAAYKLKDLLLKGHICFDDNKMIDELSTIKYKFDVNQRRILVSKEEMKKDGVKSPNIADALMYAISLIGQVKQKQDRQYVSNTPVYSKEQGLFEIAGIR